MESAAARLDRVFDALADETRRRILGLLASGEICVCHIHEALDIPQPTASRHLAHLRKAALVATRRDGLWVHYRLAEINDPAINGVLRSALSALSSNGAATTDRKKLSRVIDVPVTTLERAAKSCC
jgi:ArsR family transcriptional regulator, arsenate/arsenite/antimonite-responsive transcriptional repressor